MAAFSLTSSEMAEIRKNFFDYLESKLGFDEEYSRSVEFYRDDDTSSFKVVFSCIEQSLVVTHRAPKRHGLWASHF